MSRPLLTTRQLVLPLAIGLAMPMMAGSQTTTSTTGSTSGATTASTSSTSTSTSSTKLTASYATWAGSSANAQSLVTGLTSGTTVTLNASSTGTGTGTTGSTSFSPSTGKMGVGEVNIALSLAKASLTQQGITNPTPAQISAALNGGIVTSATGTMNVPGVLAQRASGMGWGQIAQAMGVKLGSVVSASKTDKAKAVDAGKKSPSKAPAQSAHPSVEQSKKPDAHGAGGEGHGGGHGGGNGGGGGGGKK